MTCCWCYFSWIDDDGMLLQEKISWEKDFVAITAALKEANGRRVERMWLFRHLSS